MTEPELSTKYIDSITDWRGERLSQLRRIILSVDPTIGEEWKWDVPVFTQHGLVCAISAFKDHVKINFFNGAILSDPQKLFNSGLESKKNRSINFSENDKVNEDGLRELLREAIVKNSNKN